MDYQGALDYLYSFIAGERQIPRPPPELNLARTSELLARLGEPQRAFASVVVAGTKGKGSTCAMIEAGARAAGLRTGLWTSPHLHSYRERIQVNRELISRDELVRLVTKIQPHVAAVAEATGGPPVTFAIGFALALQFFAERSVELAVLEVGLGGRFDSANVVTPRIAAITAISHDHTEILGETLAEIAWQKAGIIKPGVPAVTGHQAAEAMAVLERVASDVGARLCVAEPDQMPLGLLGAFQRENAAIATSVLRWLRDSGLPIGEDAITTGLAGVRWPGRLEIVGDTPPVVLDGAHNGESAARLVESLRELYPGQRLALVFGTSKDKDLARMLAVLAPVAGAVLLTHAHHPRSLTDLAWLAEQFAPLLSTGTPLLLQPAIAEAIIEARGLVGPQGIVCVTGSLFVVAEAREALGLENERD
jgi:dihydrofolate synthase/folylpolyglutamate synthase